MRNTRLLLHRIRTATRAAPIRPGTAYPLSSVYTSSVSRSSVALSLPVNTANTASARCLSTLSPSTTWTPSSSSSSTPYPLDLNPSPPSSPPSHTASEADNAADTVGVTPNCLRRVRQLRANESYGPEALIRVQVDSGGCSGFQYAFEIEKGPDYENEDDHFFGHDEESRPAVVIDDVSLEFVKGSSIDFEEEMVRSSFAVVDNPNAEQGCGCGISFSPLNM